MSNYEAIDAAYNSLLSITDALDDAAGKPVDALAGRYATWCTIC